MELDYTAIGRRIRDARKETGLSQEALGEMVGLSTSHVCHMEGGSTKPSLNSLVQVANALHVTMDRLLSDTLDMPYDSYKDDFLAMLQDCSEQEKEYLLQAMLQIKAALRRKL